MAKTLPILIGCPQYQKLVRGTYACGPDGRYLLGPNGSFLLERVRCAHDGGRCAQTLCVLHRYNRLGDSSWYPSRLVPVRQSRPRPDKRRPAAARERGGTTDLLC